MSKKAFYKNLINLFLEIEKSIEEKRILPALILIYSGIDIVASLERTTSEGTKSSFTRWVDNYLLKSSKLSCSAIDLYAARCGVLHTLTSKSDLSVKGKAKEVFYAWGIADAEELQEASKRLGGYDHIVLHVSELLEAFRKGVKDFLDELEKDSNRSNKIFQKTDIWFSELAISDVKKYLKITNR